MERQWLNSLYCSHRTPRVRQFEDPTSSIVPARPDSETQPIIEVRSCERLLLFTFSHADPVFGRRAADGCLRVRLKSLREGTLSGSCSRIESRRGLRPRMISWPRHVCTHRVLGRLEPLLSLSSALWAAQNRRRLGCACTSSLLLVVYHN
jgi:hypothetical protein